MPAPSSPRVRARPAAVAAAPRAAAAAPAAAPRAAEPKTRFGIGSLINRMAGGHAEMPERATPAVRSQPQAQGYDDEQDMGADQERIEIPAFLRRQAN